MTTSCLTAESTGAVYRRLFIVGTDASIVNAMRVALRSSSGVDVFGVIDANRRSFRAAVREAQPDIVVVDGLSDARAGVERVREIRAEMPHAVVLLLSAPLDELALDQVLQARAIACLAEASRPEDAAPAALAASGLETVADGARATSTPVADGHGTGDGAAGAGATVRPAVQRSPLTAREFEILRAVAEGHTNARIARQLWVTEQTVKFHLSNVYRKLGVTNRTEASRHALMHGWIAR
jgi:DNA-binding NarL/FixJ family response regulator